jgi:hypothetical protein
MAITFGLSKDYLKYIKVNEIVKNENDTYTIPFVSGETETLEKVKIKEKIKKYIDANKDILETALNEPKEEKQEAQEAKENNHEVQIISKQETMLTLRKETQDFIEENIEDLKRMLIEYRLSKGQGETESYIKLDIPDFIKSIPTNKVLSVKGDLETYNKFKEFAKAHGISVGTLFNFLIYKLLSGFNAW